MLSRSCVAGLEDSSDLLPCPLRPADGLCRRRRSAVRPTLAAMCFEPLEVGEQQIGALVGRVARRAKPSVKHVSIHAGVRLAVDVIDAAAVFAVAVRLPNLLVGGMPIA